MTEISLEREADSTEPALVENRHCTLHSFGKIAECKFFLRSAENPSFTEGRKSTNAIRLRYFIVPQNRHAQNPFIRVPAKYLSGIIQTKYLKTRKNTKTNIKGYF